jgi:hypothetical protein
MEKYFELYDERAAIKQFDGKMLQVQAEKEAQQEILELLKSQPGVSEKDIEFFNKKIAEKNIENFINLPRKN